MKFFFKYSFLPNKKFNFVWQSGFCNLYLVENNLTMTSILPALHTATLGTGCFWCTDAIFQQLKGVESVTCGYSGGHLHNPTYEQVCGKQTGHAECLNIVYNPALLSFDELLEVFWKSHDPTTLNRQGNDIGPQYRSVIFYHNEAQRSLAEKYKARLNTSDAYPNPVVTTLEPFTVFYPAENYHQDYFNLRGSEPYCQLVVKPKVEKFEKIFRDKLKGN